MIQLMILYFPIGMEMIQLRTKNLKVFKDTWRRDKKHTCNIEIHVFLYSLLLLFFECFDFIFV